MVKIAGGILLALLALVLIGVVLFVAVDLFARVTVWVDALHERARQKKREVCARCGHSNDPGDYFCAKCAGTLPALMKRDMVNYSSDE